MTIIGASTTFPPSPLLTQEQAQLTQNPPAKNSPQNQEESLTSKIAIGMAIGLSTLGFAAAFKAGENLVSHGAEYYWQDRQVEANLNDGVFWAKTSIALSTLGVIASKAPKTIDAAKNFIFSNEDQPVVTKSREEKTFPYKILYKGLLKAGFVFPGSLGLGASALSASLLTGRYLLGMCEETLQFPFYRNNEPFTVNHCRHMSNDLEKCATTAIISIAMLTLGMLSLKALDRATSLKSKAEKVDQSADVQSRDVQGPEAMPNTQ